MTKSLNLALRIEATESEIYNPIWMKYNELLLFIYIMFLFFKWNICEYVLAILFFIYQKFPQKIFPADVIVCEKSNKKKSYYYNRFLPF